MGKTTTKLTKTIDFLSDIKYISHSKQKFSVRPHSGIAYETRTICLKSLEYPWFILTEILATWKTVFTKKPNNTTERTRVLCVPKVKRQKEM